MLTVRCSAAWWAAPCRWCLIADAVARVYLVAVLDVKTAVLYDGIPNGRIAMTKPPHMWVGVCMIPPGTYWLLQKALYGLRE